MSLFIKPCFSLDKQVSTLNLDWGAVSKIYFQVHLFSINIAEDKISFKC
jgi:hypothetical protein